MSLRAKFRCDYINTKTDKEIQFISLCAVTNGSKENEAFSKFTPSGQLTIAISNDTPAANYFELGKEYYLDFSQAK